MDLLVQLSDSVGFADLAIWENVFAAASCLHVKYMPLLQYALSITLVTSKQSLTVISPGFTKPTVKDYGRTLLHIPVMSPLTLAGKRTEFLLTVDPASNLDCG